MIEVGEEEDTWILNTPKKKTHATKEIPTPKNPKTATPKETIASRKYAPITTKGNNEYGVRGSSSIQWKNSNVDTFIILCGEMELKWQNTRQLFFEIHVKFNWGLSHPPTCIHSPLFEKEEDIFANKRIQFIKLQHPFAMDAIIVAIRTACQQ